MASIRDVAALAGVSAATVSRVLNNDTTYKIREETRSKVWDATARTGYKQKAAPHSNKAAAAPLDKRIGCILSVTKDKYRDPYFMSIYAGVEARLMEKGYSIAFLKTYYEVQEPETLRAILEAPPAGQIHPPDPAQHPLFAECPDALPIQAEVFRPRGACGQRQNPLQQTIFFFHDVLLLTDISQSLSFCAAPFTASARGTAGRLPPPKSARLRRSCPPRGHPAARCRCSSKSAGLGPRSVPQ